MAVCACVGESISSTWLLLQIADSAFPTGGFSHSLGFEAAVKHQLITTFKAFKTYAVSCLQNAGSFSLPYVTASHKDCHNLESVIKLDERIHAYLSNHISNKASLRQGNSFVTTSSKAFEHDKVKVLTDTLEAQQLHGHFAPMFGCVCGLLGLPLIQTQQLFLFSTLRTIIASAVRLGQLGPLKAQAIQFKLQKIAEDIRQQYSESPVEAAVITSPLADIAQGLHDNLFSRLFYS